MKVPVLSDVFLSAFHRHYRINLVNKYLSYRRETALQGGSLLAKCNWETKFCGHYRSIFNHRDVIGLLCPGIFIFFLALFDRQH